MAKPNLKEPIIGPEYVSGRWYTGAILGQAFTSTNTTPLVDDVAYAVPMQLMRDCTITDIAFRTSGSNASVGANIKVALYASDGVDGAPGNLLSSTSAIAVTDAALSTAFSGTFDKPVYCPRGIVWAVFLQDATTGVRMAIPAATFEQSQFLGNLTAGNIYGGASIIYGYTGVATYAGGFPASFGTATINSTVGLSPIPVFKVG